MPDRGKQPLHFPGSFLGTGVRYLSKEGVAPPVAAGCRPSPESGQSSPKAALCHAEQGSRALLWAVRAFPWLMRSFAQGSCRLQSHQGSPAEFGRKFLVPGQDSKKEAVSGYGFSGLKAPLERAQGCDLRGRTGVCGCRVYHRPLYPAARQCQSWAEALLQQMLGLPGYSPEPPQISELAGGSILWQLCNPNMLFAG